MEYILLFICIFLSDVRDRMPHHCIDPVHRRFGVVFAHRRWPAELQPWRWRPLVSLGLEGQSAVNVLHRQVHFKLSFPDFAFVWEGKKLYVLAPVIVRSKTLISIARSWILEDFRALPKTLDCVRFEYKDTPYILLSHHCLAQVNIQ